MFRSSTSILRGPRRTHVNDDYPTHSAAYSSVIVREVQPVGLSALQCKLSIRMDYLHSSANSLCCRPQARADSDNFHQFQRVSDRTVLKSFFTNGVKRVRL